MPEVNPEDIDIENSRIVLQFVVQQNGDVAIASDNDIFEDADLHMKVFSALNYMIQMMPTEASPEVVEKLTKKAEKQKTLMVGNSDQIH